MSKRTEAQERMAKAVEKLTEYMRTYDKQVGYMDYSDEIFIDDVLYGLGIALDEAEYSYADGYRKFKARLKEHLEG